MTARGQTWLNQFEEDDRAVAAELVDAIRFVPGGDIVQGVRRKTEELIAASTRSPSTIVPVLAREDMRPLAGSIPARPIVFEDFAPLQDLDAAPGSEALFAHLIREIRHASPSGLLVQPASLDSMKTSRVRTLVCQTDYIGSGQQVLDYVHAWCRHPTIRSWRSYHLLDIVVVAFAATTRGLTRVHNDPHVDRLELVEIAPDIDHLGGVMSRPKMIQLCELYARRGRLKGRALGHAESAGLFASSFSVPNNLPAILIRRSRWWQPFFDGRSISAAASAEIGDYRPEAEVLRMVESTGQERLAARIAAGDINRRWIGLLSALALMPVADDELARSTGITLLEAQVQRATLGSLGLVACDGVVTAAGKRALVAHGRKRRAVGSGIQGTPTPYYPRSMR